MKSLLPCGKAGANKTSPPNTASDVGHNDTNLLSTVLQSVLPLPNAERDSLFYDMDYSQSNMRSIVFVELKAEIPTVIYATMPSVLEASRLKRRSLWIKTHPPYAPVEKRNGSVMPIIRFVQERHIGMRFPRINAAVSHEAEIVPAVLQ
jgi:hypothetical protein